MTRACGHKPKESDWLAHGEVRLEVLANDPLRGERLTRSLHRDLTTEGLCAELVQDSIADVGVKGAVEATVAILVAAAPMARPTADLLSTTIRTWLQRDRRTILRVVAGGRTVELTGKPTQEQRAVLDGVLSFNPEPRPDPNAHPGVARDDR